ncbi:ATP-binding protein [Campylobacter jejuni]|uniref:ATP-binding protein n=4 Tax=Campylobacter TaxID=194 RepID=A0A5Y7ETS9_CAMCO|nr:MULTISPECIES: AAA family ATPase [Campylobacter]HEE9521998.1 ATP-binding protein [Campylobacter jejuni subsp. jejuni]ALV99089.1 recombinase RecR [Campylobacter jejuni]ALW03872.1 recombinase RecR [Campylobacter jejuni]ALW12812.1 recombinase RecR [Campylobacter jejuni]ALW16639.1 recombinase RecR [Campylobacter jejuni]
MLRKIEISGLYSFGIETQIVDFTAKPKSKLKNTKYEYNFNLSQVGKPMKSAVFFGKNTSGKTNFFIGVKILLNIIKYGFSHTLREHLVDNAFNKNSNSVKLNIELSDNSKNIFAYSIEFNKEYVLKETFLKNNKIIYKFENERATFDIYSKKENEQLGMFFSRKLSENIFYFLKDFEIEQKEIFINLINNIEVYMNSNYSKKYNFEFEENKKQYFLEHKESILEVFQLLDKTIKDFEFKKYKKDEKNIYEIFFIRNGKKFNYQIESEGIKKIVYFADKITQIIKEGKIIFIDELDSSISTLALILIFNNLINTEENHNGQLIVSSHNVLLFDVSFLNSQQIFLIQKDQHLESKIRTYYDYDIRSEKKKAYIDYLKGLYDE